MQIVINFNNKQPIIISTPYCFTSETQLTLLTNTYYSLCININYSMYYQHIITSYIFNHPHQSCQNFPIHAQIQTIVLY